mmetsp:Transcript_102719/g.296938  ORF Transcript_102719/g.296938 Transcript_102719/m.296938 type:complete len:251 (+) Transcript_102719:346-1098(+)
MKSSPSAEVSMSFSTTSNSASHRASSASTAAMSMPPPGPRTTSGAMPASFAWSTSVLLATKLITETTSAGNRATSLAFMRLRKVRAVAAKLPSPRTEILERLVCCLSRRPDNTEGYGIDTPTSCGVSQQLSAPWMTTTSSPDRLSSKAPATIGSSSKDLSVFSTSSTSSTATTTAMPTPQLKVANISLTSISNFHAIHLNTAGSSHFSAFRLAFKCWGKALERERKRPPLVMGAAAFIFPDFASATKALE